MRYTLRLALLLLAAVVCSAEDVPVAPREPGLSAEYNFSPRIIASGSDFVVVWGAGVPRFARMRHADDVRVTGELGQPGTVLGLAAGPGGSVLVALTDADGIRIARIAYGGDVQISDKVAASFASMAWNGTRLLFVTREGETLFMDESGRILTRGPTLVLGHSGAAVAARGTGFVVTWAAHPSIHIMTFTNGGAVTREQTIPSDYVGSLAISCANASTCLLLTPYNVRLLGVESIGSEIRLGDVYIEPFAPVWDGQRFLVAWDAEGKTHMVGVRPNGSVVQIGELQWPGHLERHSAVLAHTGGETVVAWTEEQRCASAGTQIVARSLATDREVRLTQGLATQAEAAITAGTDTALVAWVERGGTARVRARVLPFSEPAFDVSDGPASSTPVIGTDGTNYLVAWHEALADNYCRKALRISLAGSGTIHTLAQGVDSGLQIAWNGSEYVVLWETDEPTGLFAVRVDRTGQPIDSEPVAVSDAEVENNTFLFAVDHEPAGLFWTGDGYLLVWRRSRVMTAPIYPTPPPQYDARTTRLGLDLRPIGAPQSLAASFALRAARKGDTIVAIWHPGGTLQAARLSPEGAVLETRPFDADVDVRDPLRLIPTRTGYSILAWDEILNIGDDLSLTSRRPVRPGQTGLLGTQAGIHEVYELGGSVYLSLPEIRRRRAAR